MIEQTLSVVALDGATAILQAEPKPACEGCNGKCGSQVFSRLFKTDKKTFPVKLAQPVQIGQKIRLALDDSKLVNHGFWVYMVPLILAFVGMFLAALVFSLPEPGQILFAALGGVVGALLAKSRVSRLKHEVKVIKIYPISLPVTQIDGD